MAIIQYKGNFYDTNNPQQNAELLRLQRAENINSGSSTDVELNVYKNKENHETEYEECLSCQ